MTTNPTSNLEVVSLLNVLSQATSMYYTYAASDYPNYTPKVYLATLETIATYWILDSNTTPKLTWPQAFQGPQKGEANKYKQKKLPFLNTSKQQFVNYLSIISLF